MIACPETAAPTVDLHLIRKYNIPGPRYTSYPPATHFKECTDRRIVIDKIRSNDHAARPLSLYYHLPFCRSQCWYCGCTTVITREQKQSARYLGYVQKEMDLICRHLNPGREVVQLHLGGGTPNFLLPEELRALAAAIRSRFRLSEGIEAGVELDPRGLTQQHVAELRAGGFNRASIGVQDHDPVVQQAVHRLQPFELTAQAVRWLRAAGFQSVNFDLIYGLPHQTPDSYEKTLEDVLSLAPDRLAIFNYAHVPWIKPHQRAISETQLPSAQAKLEILRLIIEKLTGAGYVYIGMDHFARDNDELVLAQRSKKLQRNFQGYSTFADADIYSFGMSSISQTPDIYWQNHKDLLRYCEALDTGRLPLAKSYILTADDKIRRDTIMRLMCDLELDFDEMSARHQIDFPARFHAELDSLAPMESDGLVEINLSGLLVTEIGRLLIRNIAMRFDATLHADTQTARYSKTV